MDLPVDLLPGSSSSSSSSLTPDDNHQDYKYDVFISFRGADTRNSFTDHLYNALLDAGFIAFLDEEEIVTGKPLKPELEFAIKSSKASIIVLSKNYASSTWCLDELVLILKQNNQIVIPIFFDVEPTDVRKQQHSFGEAMAEHKKKMDAETDAEKIREWGQKMESWKSALTHVACIKGIEAKGRRERELIKEVANEIQSRFGISMIKTLPRLIGMDDYINYISSWLTDGSLHTADILTVVGMGGIGKTSLAKYVFRLHSRNFLRSSFIENISTNCKEVKGILKLQKQLHGDISRIIRLQVHDVSLYSSKIENALSRKRVFIVLDDIGSIDQLDALLGKKGLHPGSKIIITTNNASLTQRCALFCSQDQPKHTQVLLNGLSYTESLELFCIHAFMSQKPEEDYKEVSDEFVKYCDGHPWTLEVLGKFLRRRDVNYWEDYIKVLKKEPHSCIQEAFQISFDSLRSNNDKELFKHIACFFVGKDRNLTETILNACGIETKSGIRNLIHRCLLSIESDTGLVMRSFFQEMGRYIVYQESPRFPENRSRLWRHEESFKVLKQKKGSGNILGLALDMTMLDIKRLRGSFELKTESLSNMNSLMLLQLNYMQFNKCFGNFPEELRWLCMRGFPLESIPLDLPMGYLVALDMSYSKIESFDMSKDKQFRGSLKILDLSFCEQLHRVDGFSELPALEKFIVRNCVSLIEVCESIEQCVELVHIDLSNCCKLKRVPISIGKLKNVKTLLLDGCNSSESGIESIPSLRWLSKAVGCLGLWAE